MKLLDYIKGQKRGRDANSIEKGSLRDAFLYEALEGYDSVNGNHAESIKELQKRIKTASRQTTGLNQLLRVASIVAVFLFGIGGYLLIDNKDGTDSYQSLSAMNGDKINSMINVFVPQDFYIEHKAVIKEKNHESKLKLADIDLAPFKITGKDAVKITESEMIELSREVHNQSIIEIYVPNKDYTINEMKIAKGNIRSEIIVEQDTTSSISIFIPEVDFIKANSKSNN